MHYLIDGHNLIAALPGISLQDPDDEIKLILLLRSWAVARRKREVTVFFDGGLPGGYRQRLSTSRIQVVFASVGKTADSLLIGRIRQAPNPPEYTLVSSDRAVQAAAESRKMAFLASDEFAKMLAKEKVPPEPKVQPSDEPVLSSDEVADWLELFGPEPEMKEPVQPPPRKKTAAKKKKPDTAEQDRSPATAKAGERKLDRDEVDEWLDLFRNRGD